MLKKWWTRMHSSRMRTARSLRYGSLCPRGVSLTETPPPLGQKPPGDPLVMWPVVHTGTETPLPVNRITDTCKNITDGNKEAFQSNANCPLADSPNYVVNKFENVNTGSVGGGSPCIVRSMLNKWAGGWMGCPVWWGGPGGLCMVRASERWAGVPV